MSQQLVDKVHFPEQTLYIVAEVNIVLVVYTHRVKQFQEESGGDPTALLIPALLNGKVPLRPLFGPPSSTGIHRLCSAVTVPA